MEQLQINHIAPYLPYGLKWYHSNRVGLNQVTLYNANTIIAGVNNQGYKIALRPLSDLYKEIDGEVPADILFPKEFYSLIDFYEEHNRENQIRSFIKDGLSWCEPYSFWEYLFSKHFDVFGLIDKELAIDLNSINHE